MKTAALGLLVFVVAILAGVLGYSLWMRQAEKEGLIQPTTNQPEQNTIGTLEYMDGTTAIIVDELKLLDLVNAVTGEDKIGRVDLQVHEDRFPQKIFMKSFQVFDEENTDNIAFGCTWNKENDGLEVDVFIDRDEYEKWVSEVERLDKLNKSFGYCLSLINENMEADELAVLQDSIYAQIAEQYQVLTF